MNNHEAKPKADGAESASTAELGVADPSWDADTNDMTRDELCHAVGELRVEIIRRGHVEAVLRRLAQAVLDTRNAEAKLAMTMGNERANFHRGVAKAQEGAYLTAMVAASEAETALSEALATPNVQIEALPASR